MSAIIFLELEIEIFGGLFRFCNVHFDLYKSFLFNFNLQTAIVSVQSSLAVFECSMTFILLFLWGDAFTGVPPLTNGAVREELLKLPFYKYFALHVLSALSPLCTLWPVSTVLLSQEIPSKPQT